MTKEESDLIITEQNKSTEEILKAVAKVKSDYHELCKLKDKRIAELEKENVELIGKIAFLENDLNNAKAQIEKMKCCENCRYCNKWGEANSNSPNCKKCNWVSNWKLRR